MDGAKSKLFGLPMKYPFLEMTLPKGSASFFLLVPLLVIGLGLEVFYLSCCCLGICPHTTVDFQYEQLLPTTGVTNVGPVNFVAAYILLRIMHGNVSTLFFAA